jgi:nanoRNase/pAp phosphatase (c-di-AMP/oligoRNAs hydrolase)
MSKSEATRSGRKVEQLLAALEGKRSLVIVMQDNPDPDSIASAAALRRLANLLRDVPCSIAYGGRIGRGENRALAEYLGLNFRKIAEVDVAKFDAIALVDTQPGTGNNSLPDGVLPDLVLDHHPLRPDTRRVAFTDVRSKYGALSSILVEYLRERDIVPEPPLATALLYAIRTDTQDLGTRASKADIEAYEFLQPLTNTRMLSLIQRGSVHAEYFQGLADALHGARLYGRAILSNLGDVAHADMISESADLFLRHEDVDWVLCWGYHHDRVWLSMRTTSRDHHAGEVMRKVTRKVGSGGGHVNSAGGQVVAPDASRARKHNIARTVRQRFLRAIKNPETRGKKLVHF